MDHICVRLTRGADLKREIERIARENDIACGVVSSAVGCLLKARLRTADGVTVREIPERCEIVSATGTVSRGRCHVHISVADGEMRVFGGHLVEGCVVNTTCELVIGIVKGYSIKKVFDENTGYNELEFVKE